MTWITDENGTRWREVPVRKRRKPGRALKFGDVKVGALLMRKPCAGSLYRCPVYWIVTDRWYDPVKGQDDPIAGQMVGLSQIGPDGEPRKSKSSTTVRGLASQYEYADCDAMSIRRAAVAAMEEGSVVGIGYGKVIRRRPKIAGRGRL